MGNRVVCACGRLYDMAENLRAHQRTCKTVAMPRFWEVSARQRDLYEIARLLEPMGDMARWE